MDVAIIGGHGKIALRLARLLTKRGDRVWSIIRKPEQSGHITAVDATPVWCDVETTSAVGLAAAIGKVDAVVFAAGAGPGSGPGRKETVDYGCAVKLIQAAKDNGIDRYVMISSVGADPEAPGDEIFDVYLRAKGRADQALIDSGLAYTIVRPVSLTEDPGDGKVFIGDSVPRGKIPRDDVAVVLTAVLNQPATIEQTFEVTDGEEPVEVALRAVGKDVVIDLREKSVRLAPDDDRVTPDR